MSSPQQPVDVRSIASQTPSASDDETPQIVDTRHMLMIFGLLLTAICLTVAGELLLKVAMNRVGVFSPTPEVIIRTFTEWRVIVAFALIFGGSLFWLAVISRVDFSFAYPLLALSYVISLLPARLLLGEQISWNRIVGSVVIVIGVIIVTRR